ncbi:ribonuclease HII [Candidatus Kinetoplastibacterium blastocrithidii TCC012E]|uniref:Ribonuclease HII n=1 Tax=Candidatus Kinetoplastidibacterium blastocrithidiae TCC012E TaxID=1208922 RepID=M1LBF8_9PROT|nr:ribonuclease HII [Candidatus Kinetoplastibacterium blastocrithidii]AFZ83642.1 ribonuclease HII [Candidatus Kinetoplastibacterium blastocrithidii (ex Strigomonas culicis)]AGF49763.1 ribonuclease HII [Candidatus Kinetoplastibacterium blastocrithidii TCC012E]
MNEYLNIIAGVDEAGRGALAGPVYAAAVVLDYRYRIEGLDDSKKLTPKKREQLSAIIKQKSICWSVSSIDVNEIDRINILQATLLAMKNAILKLKRQPNLVLVDGNQSPELEYKVLKIVKGDSFVPAISAASILAKTERDKEMLNLHYQYPSYLFNKHKGYGTQEHMILLKNHGPCKEHRKSFSPVKDLINM